MYGVGSRNQFLGELRDITARRCRLDAEENQVLVRLHELDKVSFGKARPVDLVDVVCERTRMFRSAARRRTARVGLLSEFPELLEALAGGTLGADHVDALVRAVPKNTGPPWAQCWACGSSGGHI